MLYARLLLMERCCWSLVALLALGCSAEPEVTVPHGKASLKQCLSERDCERDGICACVPAFLEEMRAEAQAEIARTAKILQVSAETVMNPGWGTDGTQPTRTYDEDFASILADEHPSIEALLHSRKQPPVPQHTDILDIFGSATSIPNPKAYADTLVGVTLLPIMHSRIPPGIADHPNWREITGDLHRQETWNELAVHYSTFRPNLIFMRPLGGYVGFDPDKFDDTSMRVVLIGYFQIVIRAFELLSAQNGQLYVELSRRFLYTPEWMQFYNALRASSIEQRLDIESYGAMRFRKHNAAQELDSLLPCGRIPFPSSLP